MGATKWSLSPFSKQCIVATGIALNNFAFGSGMGYPAVLLPQLRATNMGLTREQGSWIASMNAISLFAGNLLTVPAMRRGRRFTNYVVSLLHVVCWLVITLAESYEVLMIGRFLNGASHGVYLAVFGSMLGEYSSPAHRGVLFAAVSLAQGAGVFFVHFVGSFLAWQDTALLLSCFPAISFIIAVFTPESPSWLAVEARYEDCCKAFKWLRGNDEDEELDKMIEARMHFNSSKNDKNICEILRAFCKRELYVPLILGVTMYVTICSGGSLILSCYIDEVMGVLIGPGCNITGWMALLNGVRFVFSVIGMYVVKRMPRRALLLWSGFVCVLMYVAEAAYIFSKTMGLIDVVWLPVLLMVVHVAIIGLVLVTVPYTIVGEIFPLEYRGLCNFVCCVPLCVLSFVFLKTFPGLMGKVGLGGAWVVYGGVMALALVVSWRLLPETRDRTLHDIEEHFRGKPLVPDDPEARQKLNVGTVEEKVLL